MSTATIRETGVLRRIAAVWWGAVPAVLARLSRVLPVIAFDGAYLVRWPAVAAFAPPAAAAVGLLFGWLHPPGGEYTYTYSLLTVVLLAAVSGWGAGVGLAAWVGYVAGDAVLFSHAGTDPIASTCSTASADASGMCHLPEVVLFVGVPLLISYLLLAQLLLITSIAATTLRTSVLILVSRLVRVPTPAAAVLHGVLHAILVFLWTQAAPFQIRPIFSWLGTDPDATAIQPMQATGWVIVVVAGAVGIGRALLEARAVRTPGVEQRIRSLAARIAGGSSARLPRWTDAVLGVLMLFALMGGLLTTPVHAIVVLGALVALWVVRSRVARWAAWTDLVGRIPLPFRLAGLAVLTYLEARLIFETQAFTGGFETVIAALLVALAIFVLVIPEREPPPAGVSSRGAGA